MNIEDDFMWVAGNAFSEMRLMVEGAITLFEDDAGVLCRLAREAQKNEAQLVSYTNGTVTLAFLFCVKDRYVGGETSLSARKASPFLHFAVFPCTLSYHGIK